MSFGELARTEIHSARRTAWRGRSKHEPKRLGPLHAAPLCVHDPRHPAAGQHLDASLEPAGLPQAWPVPSLEPGLAYCVALLSSLLGEQQHQMQWRNNQIPVHWGRSPQMFCLHRLSDWQVHGVLANHRVRPPRTRIRIACGPPLRTLAEKTAGSCLCGTPWCLDGHQSLKARIGLSCSIQKRCEFLELVPTKTEKNLVE